MVIINHAPLVDIVNKKNSWINNEDSQEENGMGGFPLKGAMILQVGEMTLGLDAKKTLFLKGLIKLQD